MVKKIIFYDSQKKKNDENLDFWVNYPFKVLRSLYKLGLKKIKLVKKQWHKQLNKLQSARCQEKKPMTCERERMRLCLCWVTSITSPNHCYIKSCRPHKVKYNHKWCKRHGLVVTHWALVLIWNHRFESGTSFTPSFPDCPLFPQIKEAIKQKKKNHSERRNMNISLFFYRFADFNCIILQKTAEMSSLIHQVHHIFQKRSIWSNSYIRKRNGSSLAHIIHTIDQ